MDLNPFVRGAKMFHLEQTTFKSDMLESFSHNKRAKTPDNRCIKYETVKKKKFEDRFSSLFNQRFRQFFFPFEFEFLFC